MSKPSFEQAFTRGRIGSLELRNRFIKSATYEGMCPHSVPSDDIIQHHRAIAAGGVGMTTLAYCAVSPDGRTFEDQLVMREQVIPRLTQIVEAVHAEGAAISIQLGYCGFFSRNTEVSGGTPSGPSFALNLYGALLGMPFARAMSEADIQRVIDEFAAAAAMAKQAGFDAVELHLGHGYLLSQFLSPASNRRTDSWGGSLENRMRLPLAVVRRVRERVGEGYPIIAKMNLRDGFRGGLDIAESIEIARRLEAEGVDALEGSGGFISRNAFYLFRGAAPRREMIDVEHNPLQRWALRLFGPLIIRSAPFEELFFLEDARRIHEAVRIPVILLGGVVSRQGVERAMREGFDFVAMGRALIADPDFVERLRKGEIDRSRCDACNKCVAEMDRPGGVRCVLDAHAVSESSGLF